MTLKQRFDEHDRQIAAIRTLMKAGMKMLVRSEKRIDQLTTAVDKLTKSQEKTDAQLQAFLRSINKGGNGDGHHKLR